MSPRVWIIDAISLETSLAQCSSVLNATTRTGSLNCPVRKIVDDSFNIGSLDFGLAIDAAAAKAINYQIDRLIRAVRHGARRPPRPGHGNTPTQRLLGNKEAYTNKLVPGNLETALSWQSRAGPKQPDGKALQIAV